MLIANPTGHYHFLKGIDPYAGGVISDPGYEIVHVTFRNPPGWRRGFERIAAHLDDTGLEPAALCGVQLRCPAPYTFDGFQAFNQDYHGVIDDWGLLRDGLNPVAHTNVAPASAAPDEPRMFAFSYTLPDSGSYASPSLVISGAGELRDGVLVAEGIVRRGDTSPEAMRAKAAHVMKEMEVRLDGLGARWDLLNQVNVYTVYLHEGLIEAAVLNRLGPARRLGVHWHQARPPVVGIEFEMDMRGVSRELFWE